jgi:hypothetical protein
MRSISSVRADASIGTGASSFRIIRARNCSCCTRTSLAPINNRLQKVIVTGVLNVQWGQYCREMQKSERTQMWLLGDFYFSAVGQHHPHRDLQSSSRGVDDRDRSVFPLRSADELESCATERVECIEDLDMRGFCAQGTLSVGAIIPTFIASSRRAACLGITLNGYLLEMLGSFSQRGFCAKSSEASSWKGFSRHTPPDSFSSTAWFGAWLSRSYFEV